MSVRVHELAKELKLTSKELIDKLKALKVDAKSHMSVLTDENVYVIQEKDGTRRRCKICRVNSMKNYRARKKSELNNL